MNFRSAKNLKKSQILEPEGRQNAFRWVGRRVGRGQSEALESAEVRLKIRHALKPRSARRGRRIRMRHAARAPPPPYLSIGVCCSCWRFAICTFRIGVLVLASLFRLAIYCMFLKFSVKLPRSRQPRWSDKVCCKKASKICRK